MSKDKVEQKNSENENVNIIIINVIVNLVKEHHFNTLLNAIKNIFTKK